MALFEYEYEISTDFTTLTQPSDLKIDVLQKEIDGESLITPPVHHILANLDEDNCIVYFETELTTAEEDKLVEIIGNHSGFIDGVIDPEEVEDKVEMVADMNFAFADATGDYYIKFSSASWKVGTQFIFSGRKRATPVGCRMIVKGDGGLRLYDKTNGKVLFEWDGRDFGDDYNIWTFTPFVIDDLSLDESVLEIQGRKTGSVNVQISSFQLSYSSPIESNEPPIKD